MVISQALAVAADADELMADPDFRPRLLELHGLIHKLEKKTTFNTQCIAQISRYLGETAAGLSDGQFAGAKGKEALGGHVVASNRATFLR